MVATLYRAHRILMLFALGLGVALLAYGVARFVRAHDGWALVTGLGGAAGCVAVALYLRWFRRKIR